MVQTLEAYVAYMCLQEIIPGLETCSGVVSLPIVIPWPPSGHLGSFLVLNASHLSGELNLEDGPLGESGH